MEQKIAFNANPVYLVVETPNVVGVTDTFNDVKDLLEEQGMNGYVKVASVDSFETAARLQRAILAQHAIVAGIATDAIEIPMLAKDIAAFEKPKAEDEEKVKKLVRPFSLID